MPSAADSLFRSRLILSQSHQTAALKSMPQCRRPHASQKRVPFFFFFFFFCRQWQESDPIGTAAIPRPSDSSAPLSRGLQLALFCWHGRFSRGMWPIIQQAWASMLYHHAVCGQC